MSRTTPLGVMDAMTARHSVRTFTGEPVAARDLEALFQAARLAPSGLNAQPWRFKAVQDPELIRWFAQKDATRGQGWLAGAGAIIVCCADLAGYVRDAQASAFFYRERGLLPGEMMDGIDDYVRRAAEATEAARFAVAAMNVGIANTFIMLRAVELGLGTCWVGMFDEGRVRERLALGPDLRVVALLAVGHPAPGQPTRHTRKPLEDIVL
ncbi:nitroreductase family protein [Desulfocurvus sp.]|uniref:nitroreductase family protein n=1 Tax=Desulfocurvus sp. TaxID=2871698 RepID=UPI0025BCDFA5|nr:nitroreductase family protein [Desulfocurvus sp.]MCK9240846.1 nitroreductase family protein [Desulfocurvus sp.]